MKVLITGGAGFLGQHLAASLLKKGHRIEVLDDLSTSKNVFSVNTNQNLRINSRPAISFNTDSPC
jgi:nucleoside-diphosphate-sugar epimerase